MAKLQTTTPSLNKTASLAVATAAALLFFSFMGAPFVRVLAATVKSLTYWSVGLVLVAALFTFNSSVASIYVGAVWMTLGFYSELEKRGTNWKKTGLIALMAGLLFAIASLMLASKGQIRESAVIKSLLEPMQVALKNVMSEEEFYKLNIAQYLPGIFSATLVSALALGFIFEARIFDLFKLKREKIASSIKWIEFRLPDIFIWFSLFGFLFSLVELGVNFEGVSLKVIALNVSIFTGVVFFLQGISVVEYLNRFYRVGRFTKIAVYMLIFGWLGPAVSIVGLLDYWVDFRKMVRKKLK